MYNQNDSQSSESIQSSNNIWKIIIPTILVSALVVGGGVYAWQRSDQKSTEKNLQQQIVNLQNQLNQFQQTQVNGDQQKNENNLITENSQTQPITDLTANWKTYQNDDFEFKYNPNWSISYNGSKYDDSKPFLLVSTGTTSDEKCNGLGCPPKSGNRDVLTKGDTFEGAPPLNPWFKILRVRGNKWISIQVTDVNKTCASEVDCAKYLSSAPVEQKLKVDSTDYQTYNDFIDLISTLQETADSAADWKTYTYKNLSFKYPKDWTVILDSKASGSLHVVRTGDGGLQPDALYLSTYNDRAGTPSDYVLSANKIFPLNQNGDGYIKFIVNDATIYAGCAYYSKGEPTLEICNEIVKTIVD